MRILIISDHWPWPEYSGASQRTATVTEELLVLGEVDFFHIDRNPADALPVEEHPGRLRRAAHVPLPAQPAPLRLARQLRHPLLPGDLARLRGRLAKTLRAWTAGQQYALVWCIKEVAWAPVCGGVPDAPMVLDVDDLYEVTSDRWQHTKTGLPPVQRFFDGLGAWHLRRTWRRAHLRHARQASLALVCSEQDRARLPAGNVAVVHNAYRGPILPPGAGPAGPPTILFQGILTYHVNADAARLLAERVFPLVRRRIPEARLLLVGHHGGGLSDLVGRPGVAVTGLVPDMAPWLERAHVQAVPLRAGSGTRTKILEATAHGIPVVSTTIGADGLEFIRHYCRIADDPETFAEYCVELLLDRDLRVKLVTGAQKALRERYSLATMRQRIRDIADRVAVSPREV